MNYLPLHSLCVDEGDLGVVGGRPARGAPHAQPPPGGGGAGVAVLQQEAHALHAVTVAALKVGRERLEIKALE